ncbi:hypothetical protein GW17_00052106 [Ensete ventricosum]|nr:hypothetical protein GW17_00052106 [Ensete ventricosum]
MDRYTSVAGAQRRANLARVRLVSASINTTVETLSRRKPATLRFVHCLRSADLDLESPIWVHGMAKIMVLLCIPFSYGLRFLWVSSDRLRRFGEGEHLVRPSMALGLSLGVIWSCGGEKRRPLCIYVDIDIIVKQSFHRFISVLALVQLSSDERVIDVDPYCPVHTGPAVDRYVDRAVPLRSIVGGRFRPSTVDFRCRCRFKEKSTVGSRLRKKKERRRRGKEEEEEEEKYLTPPGGRPRAVAACGFFSPHARRRDGWFVLV